MNFADTGLTILGLPPRPCRVGDRVVCVASGARYLAYFMPAGGPTTRQRRSRRWRRARRCPRYATAYVGPNDGG
jgi:hypothetical protein